MQQRILVPVNFTTASARALAVTRAYHPEAIIRLLYVVNPSDIASATANPVINPTHARDERSKAEEEASQKLAAWKRDAEELVVAVGSPAETISEAGQAVAGRSYCHGHAQPDRVSAVPARLGNRMACPACGSARASGARRRSGRSAETPPAPDGKQPRLRRGGGFLQREAAIDGHGLTGDMLGARQIDRQLTHVLGSLRFTLG